MFLLASYSEDRQRTRKLVSALLHWVWTPCRRSCSSRPLRRQRRGTARKGGELCNMFSVARLVQTCSPSSCLDTRQTGSTGQLTPLRPFTNKQLGNAVLSGNTLPPRKDQTLSRVTSNTSLVSCRPRMVASAVSIRAFVESGIRTLKRSPFPEICGRSARRNLRNTAKTAQWITTG
jgi:hypothetical protein